MSGRIRSVTGHSREYLTSGWKLASSAPSVEVQDAASLKWQSIQGPTTAAAALRANTAWSLDGAPRRFDAEEWWFRTQFARPPTNSGVQTVLGFDGLATIADVWLNGKPLLSSDNMFVAHEVAIDGLLQADNELLLRFRSLDALLAAKRPRPRWRAPMIEHQQLRWFRTTLLGRTPGWSPPAAAVGPWRPIWLETRQRLRIGAPELQTSVVGTTGVLDLRCEVTGIGGFKPQHVELLVTRGEKIYRTEFGSHAHLEIPDVELWWPHTHGQPALYSAKLVVDGEIAIDLGRVGFRTITLDAENGNFALSINGTPVFCRGACWTPLDCATLDSDKQAVEAAIAQLVAAGMNMLRVGGTMVYENDAFLDACDEQGILLWQDFMFANMDYPEGDAAFDASVQSEIKQTLERMSGRPCLTVLCGNSEGEQQAAMWGAPRERWSPPLFHSMLPELAKTLAPGVPYWPSSAHGGAFPHQSNIGTTSYYGVGAYRRPLTDARRAEIRFATECLAFANIPEEETLALMPGGAGIKVHHPQWKARSPRDLGAGWDFDDIRDHYLQDIFGVRPLDLRYADHDRYLELGRLATGEAIASALREWRRKRSTCNGALVWFLRDFWAGAGWGLVDAAGTPKSAYYFAKRVLQPQTVSISDEGGNGLFIHLINERPESLQGILELSLFRSGEVSLGHYQCDIALAGRESLELPAAQLLPGFMDLSFAYRFGPPACDVIVASLRTAQGQVLCRDFYFPTGAAFQTETDVGLSANAQPLANGDVQVTVQTKRLARFVTVQADGFSANDRYFHLAPGMSHEVQLRRHNTAATFKGFIRAANSGAIYKIAVPQ